MLVVAASAAPCSKPLPLELSPLSAEIGKRQVVFVASDFAGNCWVTDASRALERQTPWSSFKIPHTLIALETKALSGPDEVIEWPPARHPAQAYWPKDWAQAQTLATAFARSTAWFYKELVPRIGAPVYRQWLASMRYGNASVAPGNDSFWLDGTLKISPAEQVEFLQCLLESGCGFSSASIGGLDAVALEGEAAGMKLFGKTGSGPQRSGDFDGPFEGWYVGYVRDSRHRGTAAFALFVRGASFAEIAAFRRRFAVTLLQRLGLWPAP